MNLSLDPSVIDACHVAAKRIADDVGEQTAGKTTTSIERATLRLMGIEGTGALEDQPRVNVIVDGKLDGHGLVALEREKIEKRLALLLVDRLDRQLWIDTFPKPHSPLRYVLTATGDIDQDITHALAVAEAGGDIIAMIRSTGQSLLDHVPEGTNETRHEGTGGTFNNQENFRTMRQALDEWSEKNGRYIRLSGFASGLCQPEIAAIAAIEGLDNMVCDGLYGCLYRDLNIERVLIDTHFARLILGWSGIVINTGEDNYLRTADGVEAAHTVTASQFINYYLAKRAGVRDEQIGLGHAFEIDPMVDDSLLLEIAHAQLTRELWPDCPVKYMPPTRHANGDFFRTQAMGVLFDLVGTMTNQGIMTVSVPDEAVHTPHIHSRVQGLQAMDYVHRAAASLSGELEIRDDGFIAQRANEVLRRACGLLEAIVEFGGLYRAIEGGTFGDVKRSRDGGKGREGIIEKDPAYENAVESLMMAGVA